MKIVTLYTIKAEQKEVYDRDEKVCWYHMDDPPMFLPVVDSDQKELIVLEKTTNIRRVIKRGEEIYVAIDPDLEDILMEPKTADYEEKIYQLNGRLSAALALTSGYEDRISQYNSLPWWKKIFTGRI